MRIGRNDPCPCESGRKYKHCHGSTRGERAAFEHPEARDDLRDLATMFPQLRTHDRAVEAFADRAAADGDVSDETVAAGAALLHPDACAALVDEIAFMQPHRWSELCIGAGGIEAATAELVHGVVAATIAERLPPEPHVLDIVEHSTALAGSPIEALAAALRPAHVWSVLDADEALALLEEEDDEAFDAFVDYEFTGEHGERLRALCDRVAAYLPFDGRPTASALVAEGCTRVEQSAQARFDLAAAVLANYAVFLKQAVS